MRLFLHPRSPYTKKILLAAYEKGESFAEREIVLPYDPEAMRRLREVVPLATVPLLRLDDGSYLRESSSIVEYLEIRRPEPRLVPLDPEAALRVREIDRLGEHFIGPTNFVIWAKQAPTPNEAKIEEAVGKLHVAVALLEAQIGSRSFVCGDTLTLADLGPCAGLETFIRDVGLELDRYPNVRRWYHGMLARASWQRLLRDIDDVPSPLR